MEQIRYLKQEEKQHTRGMYETIFLDDSKEFVDYYYQWKTKDNDILVMEDCTGYEVMLHLNPYQLQINGRTVRVPYIVAVATREDCRRKGKMQQVMKKALCDMQKKHIPFTFLLPANPAYYIGQGFVFEVQSEQRVWSVEKIQSSEEIQGKGKEWKNYPLSRKNLQQVAETANRILEEQYDVYVQRDVAYYERLLEETSSEQGDVLFIEKEGAGIGILAYGRDEKADIKEFLLTGQYAEYRKSICDEVFGEEAWNEEKMRMMFRITDLQALNGMLKGQHEVLKIFVTDELVAENNGVWELVWSHNGGSVTRVAEEDTGKETEDLQRLDIAEVTEKILNKMTIFIQEWV